MTSRSSQGGAQPPGRGAALCRVCHGNGVAPIRNAEGLRIGQGVCESCHGTGRAQAPADDWRDGIDPQVGAATLDEVSQAPASGQALHAHLCDRADCAGPRLDYMPMNPAKAAAPVAWLCRACGWLVQTKDDDAAWAITHHGEACNWSHDSSGVRLLTWAVAAQPPAVDVGQGDLTARCVCPRCATPHSPRLTDGGTAKQERPAGGTHE